MLRIVVVLLALCPLLCFSKQKKQQLVRPDYVASKEFFADGGWQHSITNCAVGWHYRHSPRDPYNRTIVSSSNPCVSFSELKPYMGNREDVLEPKDNRTDKGFWCSTSEVYNPRAQESIANRKKWGYCLDIAKPYKQAVKKVKRNEQNNNNIQTPKPTFNTEAPVASAKVNDVKTTTPGSEGNQDEEKEGNQVNIVAVVVPCALFGIVLVIGLIYVTKKKVDERRQLN